MSLIGNFGQKEQVIPAKTFGRFPLVPFFVETGHGNVEPRACRRFVSPYCGLDRAKADFVSRLIFLVHGMNVFSPSSLSEPLTTGNCKVAVPHDGEASKGFPAVAAAKAAFSCVNAVLLRDCALMSRVRAHFVNTALTTVSFAKAARCTYAAGFC